MKPHLPLIVSTPDGDPRVLLHACCAPCSSAILECMLRSQIEPTVLYFNPNIFPEEEYLKRKAESIRQVQALGLNFVDGDYDHKQWLASVAGLEAEPERGERCLRCFEVRLLAAAQCAQQQGIKWFSTTLASSRWKSLAQIESAAMRAAQMVEGTAFWAQNWRKGGLSERRSQLLKEGNFYNQLYCGCEFSMRK